MQIKNNDMYNIREDKHIKAHKSTLISNVVLKNGGGSGKCGRFWAR